MRRQRVVRMGIDAIIPTYNNFAALRHCLAALEDQTFRDFHVWVCVDGSTDGTLDGLRAERTTLSFTVIEHPDGAHRGRAATRNLALPHLTADDVLFLDSDVILERDSLARHVELLDREDVVSIGRVDYANADRSLWGRYLMTRGARKASPGAFVRPLDFNTQNAALRTHRLLSSGGFDESFVGWGGEDVELGLRLGEAGARFVYNALARGETMEQKTVRERLADLRAFGEANLPRIIARHPNASPYGVQRFDSNRWQDRVFRAAFNPATDALVRCATPLAPFAVQRHLLNYQIVRAVMTGYASWASEQRVH